MSGSSPSELKSKIQAAAGKPVAVLRSAEAFLSGSVARLKTPTDNAPKPGEAPGLLRSPAGASRTQISSLRFGPDEIVQEGAGANAPAMPALEPDWHRWINFTGLQNVDALSDLLTPMGLNNLLLEDILSVHQRPHADDMTDDKVIMFLRMVRADEETEALFSEQVAIVCTDNTVVTVQEVEGDVFDAIRTRMKDKRGRMRRGGAPYLAYALLDAVIDGFYPVLEAMAEKVELAEQQVLDGVGDNPLHEVHLIKREVAALRRLLWPMRDMVSALIREADEGIGPFASLNPEYLRDCRDHVLQLVDLADGVIETCSAVRDMIIADSGQKLNEVMGMLTVIATIFMPLGFLAGIWGMNFDPSSPFNMPELGLRYGYPMALGLMACVGIGLVIWFKKKGWL